MKKSRLLLWMIYAVIFIIYNLILWFILPHNSSHYLIAYAFSFMVFIICGVLTFVSPQDRADAIVKGASLTVISALFLTIQCVLGMLITVIPLGSRRAIIVIEMLLLLLFIVVALVVSFGRQAGDEIDNAIEKPAGFRNYLLDILQNLYRNTQDGEVRTLLVKLSDDVRYCGGEILLRYQDQMQSYTNTLSVSIKNGDIDTAKETINHFHALF